MKRSNIHALKIPEREERDNGAETMSEEIITRNFMKVMKDIKLCTSSGTMNHRQDKYKENPHYLGSSE